MNPVWRPGRAGSGWVMALNFAAVWRAARAKRRGDPALEARDGPLLDLSSTRGGGRRRRLSG